MAHRDVRQAVSSPEVEAPDLRPADALRQAPTA
jgi:hypothetical protein